MTDKDILRMLKKRSMTLSSLRAFFDRQERDNVDIIVDGLLKAQYVERLPGTIYDGAEYRITSRGEAYL